MNSAYSNLINSIPTQISLSGNFQEQINPIFNYSNLQSNPNTDSSPILNLYNPAYAAAAQSRLLSSLQTTGSPIHNNLTSPDASVASSITSADQNQNLPPFNHGHSDTASPGANIPFYGSSHPFPNNNQLCCDFGTAWRSAAHMMANDHNPYVNYETAAWSSPYGYMGNPTLDLNSARRKNATRESTSTLKAWLQEHIKNPYPTKGEKIMLAIITKMTLTQVSTWFANARRRLKKENKMTWSPKNRSDDATNSDLETEIKGKDNDSDDGIKTDCHLEALSDTDDVPIKNGFVSAKMSDVKPKIWSLAHTATSGLFPMALQPYPGQCVDNQVENGPSHQYAMPLIQSHPLYPHGFNHPLDIPNQLSCSEMKHYSSLYADNNSNNFFAQSQKRSELL